MLVWQLSHDALVLMCPAGLPSACVPLWQVAQDPVATPAWLNAAPAKLVVLKWQDSQPALVVRWLG